MDSTPALIASCVLSLAAFAVALTRRRNHIHEDLRAQLDQALAENARLITESAVASDRIHALELKLSPESLSEHAAAAVAYAEQMGGSGEQKLRHALGASILSDKGANGTQDWTDAQHRIAIEGVLGSRK
jgi:hypothetical protein